MEWYLLLIVVLAAQFIFRRPNLYLPERVLVEDGEFLFIEDLPKSKLSKAQGRRINKSFVHRIQLAGNIVTFFNGSSNAVDIMLPNSALANPIFERAKQLFPNAESEEINC
jgi:hypothetical protein